MNEKKMMAAAALIFISWFLSIAYAAPMLRLQFSVSRNDVVEFVDVAVIDSSPMVYQTAPTTYTLKIYDAKKAVIDIYNISVNFDIPEAETDKAIIYIRLPYSFQARYLNLLDNNDVIKEIDLSSYICNNNGICERNMWESEELCNSECSPTEPSSDTISFAIPLLLAITIILGFYLYRERKISKIIKIVRRLEK